jgi:hypothetical protein
MVRERLEMKKFLIIFWLMLTAPGFAADQKPAPNDLGITAKDCQALVEYQPSPDVEYKPGVDVHGKPVVEADITPQVVTLPDKYSFDLNVDAARYLGIAVPPGTQGLAKIGTIMIDKTGAATFNGKPMEGEAMAALKDVCAAKKVPDSTPHTSK